MMERFLRWTSWPMDVPKPYGLFHLSFFLLGLVLCLMIATRLRHESEKRVDWILFGCGAILLVLELYKQAFYLVVIGNGTYQWWVFPFQLCSVPMYLCLLLPFIKSARIKEAMHEFLLIINGFGGFVAFLEPSGLLHPYYSLTFHAFLWHMMLIFIALLLWRTNLAGNHLNDFKKTLPVFAVVVAVAETINVLFRSKPGINMFFISPFHTSSIIVFKTINERLGWYVSAPLFLLSLLLGAFLFFLMLLWLKKKLKIHA